MDASMVSDEASVQMALVVQREEARKIFNVPGDSFLGEMINRGVEFQNLDADASKANPDFVHERRFKVNDFLGDDVKTVDVSKMKIGDLTKTNFVIYKETPDGRSSNRLEISYEDNGGRTPSKISINAVPSGMATGVAFELDSNNQFSYIDAIKFTGSGLMDVAKAPPVMKVFDGMELSGLKAEANQLSFQLAKFPHKQSQPVKIDLPRALNGQ